MNTTFCIINAIACIVLIWHSLCTLNKMTIYTNHFLRFAYILIAVGSLGILVSPANLIAIQVPMTILTLGVSMALIVGARRRRNIGSTPNG